MAYGTCSGRRLRPVDVVLTYTNNRPSRTKLTRLNTNVRADYGRNPTLENQPYQCYYPRNYGWPWLQLHVSQNNLWTRLRPAWRRIYLRYSRNHHRQNSPLLTAKIRMSVPKETKPKTYQLNPEQTLVFRGPDALDFTRSKVSPPSWQRIETHRTKLKASAFYDKQCRKPY